MTQNRSVLFGSSTREFVKEIVVILATYITAYTFIFFWQYLFNQSMISEKFFRESWILIGCTVAMYTLNFAARSLFKESTYNEALFISMGSLSTCLFVLCLYPLGNTDSTWFLGTWDVMHQTWLWGALSVTFFSTVILLRKKRKSNP